jgi:hypothetical protein
MICRTHDNSKGICGVATNPSAAVGGYLMSPPPGKGDAKHYGPRKISIKDQLYLFFQRHWQVRYISSCDNKHEFIFSYTFPTSMNRSLLLGFWFIDCADSMRGDVDDAVSGAALLHSVPRLPYIQAPSRTQTESKTCRRGDYWRD